MHNCGYELHPDVESVDLEDIASYIAQENPVAADQVTKAIIETFDLLAKRARMGTEYHPIRRVLRGIRMFTVTDYPNYLIYYRPLPEAAGVRILYVLHAARDSATFVQDHQRQ